MTEVIRRFCEDEFAYAPRNTADGKVHFRKVERDYAGRGSVKGRSVIGPYRVHSAIGEPGRARSPSAPGKCRKKFMIYDCIWEFGNWE